MYNILMFVFVGLLNEDAGSPLLVVSTCSVSSILLTWRCE